MPELITVKQLAQFLNISPKTIYNLVSLKKIPYVKAGGALRFNWSEINSWLKPAKASQSDISSKNISSALPEGR